MPNTTTYSLPLQGMQTDLHQLNTDSKQYFFALNAMVSDKFGGNEPMLQNEMSNICSIEFPPDYQVVGFKEIPEQNRVIYFLHNPVTGMSQIGEAIDCVYTHGTDKIKQSYCKGCPDYVGDETTPVEQRREHCYCQYRLIIQSDCLNFSIYFPVDIEYKITNCSLNLYFTDNLNERRFIYFDYTNNDPYGDLIVQDRFFITTPVTEGGCYCPEGYTYNEDTELCEKLVITPVIPSSTTRVACAAHDTAYVNFGVQLYSAGYSINGTGTAANYHIGDTYWSNSIANTTNGVLNRVGLWACGAGGVAQTTGSFQPTSEYIGFLFSVDIPTTKTYFIGIAGDNEVRIRVDCVTIVNMDDSAMAIQYPAASTAATFKYWHIYPVTLPAGRHVIELTGINYGGVAGFGAEIYDNTAGQIIAAAGGAGLNIVFTTQNMVGMPLQVSNTFSGTCPGGTCLSIEDDGDLVCTSIETEDLICDDCITEVVTEELDCDKIKVHPDYNRPCIHLNGFVNGGSLKQGTYQVMIAYADPYGNPISHYFPDSQIATLFEGKIKFETNGLTNKALSFDITGLKVDSLFQYYNIVVVQTIEQFTEFILVGTFSTTQTSYRYTGSEPSPKRLSAQEVLFRRPYYQKARGVTKANNYLFYTGVSEYDLLNLQQVANRVELNWETVALKEGAYADPRNVFYFRGYQRDEVYSFGIVFEFNNGRETCVFHIPGREATETDLQTITGADLLPVLNCEEEVRNLRWQVYNTGSVLASPHEYNEECTLDKCWEYGKFAYWESTETYPKVREVWGDLCGLPIRHHKFPDSCITHIHDGNNTAKVFKDSNYIFPIGVRINHTSVLNSIAQAVVDDLITQAQADSIVSYRIVRGNRVGNKSIDAKGLLFNMWSYARDGFTYYFPNYAYNDLSADDFLNSVSLVTQRYTFHSPDTHFVNAALGNVLKVETEEYGNSQGYFTFSDCQAKHKFLSNFAHKLALGLGIAAAISATGEKTCKVITYKNDVIIAGQDGYGNVHGGSSANVLTMGSGTINTSISTSDATVNTTDTEDHTTGTFDTYDPITGAVISGGSGDASTQEITTCKGQPFQVFNSDTFLGTLFAGLNQVVQRTFLGITEMNKILDTIRALIPELNYSIQYNSAGKYNNYICVANGKKIRQIDKSAYLNPIMQEIDEPSADPSVALTSIRVNNWDRESSVYLKLATALTNPTKTDNSKVSMTGVNFNTTHLDLVFERNIASYYVAVKRNVLNQYGQLCNIDYMDTNSCSFFLNRLYTECEAKVFGGDTFINRFALKRKMPFFKHTMCGLPADSDVKYTELSNAGTPKYYFNTPQPLGERIADLGLFPAIFSALTSENVTNYDVRTSHLFHQEGYIHMFNYGIPYFFVESDVNVDLRHGENLKEKDFYPHKTDLKEWFEEDFVPISEDNYYFYNRTYSKQNHEDGMCRSCILDPKDLTCKLNTFNRLIYSEPTDTENKNDNWLIFKANNKWDFPLSKGRLISADGLEDDKVLVRLEKGMQIFNAYNTIEATGANIQVGTGGMFQSRPQDGAITDLGYAGSQHRDILHTEYGHIWADAERGQVFNLAMGGKGIDELSKEGMKGWFKENLPFQILKDFINLHVEDIDNNLNGLGLHYCFDKRFNRILITKLDYKKVDIRVQYNPTTHQFYIQVDNMQVPVSLRDTRYFCNKGWTISYNFYLKTWTAFHSYVPNMYVEHIDYFESSFSRIRIGDLVSIIAREPSIMIQRLYRHHATNKSYQVFYGKLEPFIVEFQANQSLVNNFVNSVDYYLDVIRYHNEFDTFYNRSKTFNKAIVYNESQTSGLLRMKVSNPEDLTEVDLYPLRVIDGYEILTTNSENVWNFNDFWDVSRSQYNNVPIFNYDCNNVNKKVNSLAVNYDKDDFDRGAIRQRMCRVRLINDLESNYHFIFGFGSIKQRQSYR